MGKIESACVAGGSAFCTVLSMVADVAAQVFGVPLPVLLASLTGALGARVFLPQQTFWRATVSATMWTVIGSFGSQLALWLVGRWMSADPPHGVLAGVALFTAFLGQRVMPIIWESGGEALKRKFDSMYKGDPK